MTADHPRWKWIAAGVGALALLAVAAGAVAFHALVEPERLLSQARAKAKSAWGRELAIESLGLQFLPRPAVRARHGQLC